MSMNYTLVIDKSGSMANPSFLLPGKSLYDEAREATIALARRVEQFDPDGIDLYFFSSKFKRYENVTASKVAELYEANMPIGSTRLDAVLEDCFSHINARRKSSDTNEMILIITDGEPDDRKAVASAIVAQTQKMKKDEELTILFLQIGKDASATRFLKALDDDLTKAGAKFDIVDVKSWSVCADRLKLCGRNSTLWT